MAKLRQRIRTVVAHHGSFQGEFQGAEERA